MMTFTNRTKQRRPLFVEPEGADFGMMPEQTFEVHAEITTEEGHFEVCDKGTGLSIFPAHTMGEISVFCDGQELECGHQRPPT